jgi:hypothetical protein
MKGAASGSNCYKKVMFLLVIQNNLIIVLKVDHVKGKELNIEHRNPHQSFEAASTL